VQLQKVQIGYNSFNQCLVGLKFYFKYGAVLPETEWNWVSNGYSTHTVHLEDGERVIGYRSRSKPIFDACHYDFQLIIGRLE
jgi:hypothetical protein